MIHPTKNISKEEAVELYKKLLLPRRIEERMINLLRQGKISKWFSGIGQEAISIGAAASLSDEDYLLPMHRNLGLFTTRGVDLYRLFCQLLGKADGFTNGRDRSFHFGSLDNRIVGMISHLAATLPVADGLALASRMKETGSVVCSFCGDGATSEGDFHEALNLAAVWELPVIFVIENNGYALSTPTSEQYACQHLLNRAIGYGLAGLKIDGNNIFNVMDEMADARKTALRGQPVLIEAKTFRMRGHEEASGTSYIPDELFEEWKRRDPILQLKKWIKNKKLVTTEEEFSAVADQVDQLFEDELERALNADDPVFDEEKETAAVFTSAEIPSPAKPGATQSEQRFVDAVSNALRQAFLEDDSYIMLGQDIAEYGGVFKVTEGFVEQFGKERIRNTPTMESGAVGTAIGLALEGFKPVVEMQFADFISCGFNQVINNLAKSRYRWTPPLNVTIRAPHGAGVGSGPFHSQSPEGWFMQHAGLKIVVPSSVQDAQNLLYSALMDPNPVLFFEHKKLYRSLKSTIYDHCQPEELGSAAICREGTSASIITYGMGVHWAYEIAEEYERKGVELEIVDLRCLYPLDLETVRTSIIKTNKALLLQEPSLTLGPMSELSALINEQCFEHLDAPLIRCGSLDTPIPFNKRLEEGYLASHRLKEKINQLLEY
ncbi:thiamine pyrophosphate-dependent enzyme [Halalkalibaculum sp. DA384]|uniref:alpha-ketoacid dehydrogenase subunit alpha/beta n=1 Tax=Halalkalibaculum sp. DA384 TaxID=3373606 RepID=UPI0037542C50